MSSSVLKRSVGAPGATTVKGTIAAVLSSETSEAPIALTAETLAKISSSSSRPSSLRSLTTVNEQLLAEMISALFSASQSVVSF